MTDEPWHDYEAAVVEVEFDDVRMRLEPRPVGVIDGAFPFESTEAVHVVTAFNPRNARNLTAAQNRTRQNELENELSRRGRRWWPAWGGDADQTHVEDSAAVIGMSDVEAIELGRRWGQDAIFAWTAMSWTLLPCDDREPTVTGWHISRAGG